MSEKNYGPNGEHCGSCYYWEMANKSNRGNADCRVGGPGKKWLWPQTNHDNWCGRYKQYHKKKEDQA